jgi:hypothetical protein
MLRRMFTIDEVFVQHFVTIAPKNDVAAANALH